MQSIILCVFEGEKREHQYFNNLKRFFLDEKNIVACSFGNDIYKLYKILSEDDYALDTLEILKESNDVPKNKTLLADYEVDDINQIYLFFDMDCHDESYDSQKLADMVSYFSDETDMGKMFISYPMVEAIRDVMNLEEFTPQTASLEDCKQYKQLSTRGIAHLADPRKLSKETWLKLVVFNVDVAAHKILGAPAKTKYSELSLPEQIDIANQQCLQLKHEKFIYVLSAFPIFLFHQYGMNILPNN
ncbi:hypothetical protein ACMZOO_19115 (plasmid) [Catenovulum sp. SX2]|uniref:hypothetical protein n=1 Tax=Catenovulum sp. SX2 TaxID=3398614 RepID=UPI003F859D07